MMKCNEHLFCVTNCSEQIICDNMSTDSLLGMNKLVLSQPCDLGPSSTFQVSETTSQLHNLPKVPQPILCLSWGSSALNQLCPVVQTVQLLVNKTIHVIVS